MLTLTSLKNPSYLARVKEAVLRAVAKSHQGSPDRLGYADVYNRRGAASLEIVAQRGGPVTVWTEDGRDITAMVMRALKDYHAALPKSAFRIKNVRLSWPTLKPRCALPLIQVEFDSGPQPIFNIALGAV